MLMFDCVREDRTSLIRVLFIVVVLAKLGGGGDGKCNHQTIGIMENEIKFRRSVFEQKQKDKMLVKKLPIAMI